MENELDNYKSKNNKDLFDLSLGFHIDIDEDSLIKSSYDLKFNSKIFRLRKISKIIFDKDEDNLSKLTTIFSTMHSIKSDVIYIFQNINSILNFYIGAINKKDVSQSDKILTSIFESNFNGCQISEKVLKNDGEEIQSLEQLISNNKITMSTTIPSLKDKDEKKEKFVQGLEKFLIAMKDENYTTILLAKNINNSTINERKSAYEDLYTYLFPFSAKDISAGVNYSETKGSSTSFSESITETITKTFSESTSISKPSIMGKVQISGIPTILGLASGGAIAAAGGGVMAVAAVTAAATAVMGGSAAIINYHDKKNETSNISESTNESLIMSGSDTSINDYDKRKQALKSDKNKWVDTETSNISESTAKSSAKTNTDTNSTNQSETSGTSEQISLKFENKYIKNQLDSIEMHLKRFNQSKTYGMFDFAAYFISNSTEISTTAANIYNSIIQGEDSNIGNSYIVSFNQENSKEVSKYLLNFEHPKFRISEQKVSISSLLNSKELSIAMNLPKKSIHGLPVKESIEFSKEIISKRLFNNQEFINIGNIFSLGKETEHNVHLNLKDFTMHTLVTGSTGSGKSTSTYKLLDELKKQNIKFLVIEPTKGEYKYIFGNEEDVNVYGTNDNYSELLQINPFSFPCKNDEIHILEHIDRLVEIFNACWSMYDAMPAILKDAILESYKDCGWNLDNSTNEGLFFPTFDNVLDNLNNIMNKSQYSDEVKSNYKGALSTRLESLTKGLIGKIFNDDEIQDEELFDKNVIIDISRVGSSETKSLIMGILLLKLNEYRMAKSDINSSLKHITVLEEAHHLLPRISTTGSSDSANIKGKAVEMLSNSIAEMRTYGEGFIIVDQSPNMLDISTIRNTNTKIIMRLSEIEDRRDIGKSATLNDNQINEIPKLEQGVAIVYQNGWEEAILCKIKRSDIEDKVYDLNGKIIPFKYSRKRNQYNRKELFTNIIQIVSLNKINQKQELYKNSLNHFKTNKNEYIMCFKNNYHILKTFDYIYKIEDSSLINNIEILNTLLKGDRIISKYQYLDKEKLKNGILVSLNNQLENIDNEVLDIIYRNIMIANLEKDLQMKHIEAIKYELKYIGIK